MTNFKKSEDILTSLGIGSIHCISSWLDEMGIEDYTINDDLTIDVNGSADFNNHHPGRFNLTEFPSYIQFKNVYGSFDIAHNHFKTLRGCPSYVQEDFSCIYNKLISLEIGRASCRE